MPMRDHFPLTATVTETGPAGQYQANLDHGWGAVLADGTAVRVFLTAKVRTLNAPVLELGQVIHVSRPREDAARCSVDPTDFEYVPADVLRRRLADEA